MNRQHKLPKREINIEPTKRARKLARQLIRELVPDLQEVDVVIGEADDPNYLLLLALHRFNGGLVVYAGSEAREQAKKIG